MPGLAGLRGVGWGWPVMNPAFGVALIPSLYGYAAHTTYHCAEAAYVSISLRIITPRYIPIEGWR